MGNGTRDADRAALLGDPHHQPHLLQELMRTSQALLAVFSREVGMPASRLAPLRLLAIAHPGGLGVMRMAREMGINAAAVTRTVRHLDDAGLVVVRPHPNDARRKMVSLTAKGVRTAERLHGRGHQLEESLGAGVPREELATTLRVLTRVRTAIEALRDEPIAREREPED